MLIMCKMLVLSVQNTAADFGACNDQVLTPRHPCVLVQAGAPVDLKCVNVSSRYNANCNGHYLVDLPSDGTLTHPLAATARQVQTMQRVLTTMGDSPPPRNEGSKQTSKGSK